MPHNISVSLWLLLHGHLVVMLITVARSYFGGFREMWRSLQGETQSQRGFEASEFGQMMLWKGEMNHGAVSILLLWVVLPALNTGLMNPLAFDILFVYHAAWLGIKIAFSGPLSVALTSFLVDPRMFLTIGLVLTSWDLASWQSQTALVILPLYGMFVNAFQYPQEVFGIRSRFSWCSPAWSFERYMASAKQIREPAPRTACARLRARFPTHLEREKVIVMLLERVRVALKVDNPEAQEGFDTPARSPTSGNRLWPRRLTSVLVPAILAAPLASFVVMAHRARQRWKVQRGVCHVSTGGSCSIFGCDTFRNAVCNRTPWSFAGECVCLEGHCAVDGVCAPRPASLDGSVGLAVGAGGGAIASHEAPVRALVFSGGGAKGAWEVGILKALCDPDSAASSVFGKWTMLVGTSIGALNAGFLAQFPPEEQCTRGLEAMEKYWLSIANQQDVFESPTPWHFDNFDHTSCFRLSEAPAIFSAFAEKGGLCDPAPGAALYSYEVDPKLIRNSGMNLWVVATSLNSSRARWWNEQSPDIVEGALASGALAPLLFPKVIGEEWYIDGGLVANTPVLKAIQEGAREVLVVVLEPLEIPELSKKDPLGLAIFEFEFNLFMFKYFVESELERACQLGAQLGAKIWGYAPLKDLLSQITFEAPLLEATLKAGYEFASERKPFDMCEWLQMTKGAPLAPPEAAEALAAESPAAQAGGVEPPAELLAEPWGAALGVALVVAYALGALHGSDCSPCLGSAVEAEAAASARRPARHRDRPPGGAASREPLLRPPEGGA